MITTALMPRIMQNRKSQEEKTGKVKRGKIMLITLNVS